MYFTTSQYFLAMSQKGYVPSQTVLENAEKFLDTINKFIASLFEEKLLRPDYPIALASGWRSELWNKQIGGAPLSNHVTGQAIDLVGNEIILLLEKHPDLLVKFNLYAESSMDAKEHSHLQSVPTKSGNRIFRA